MSIKPDHWIRRMAVEAKMIDPFEEKLVRQGVISYGLSSFGYDIRVADEFLIFTPATGQLTVVDPKAIDESAMFRYQGEVCMLPLRSLTRRPCLPKSMLTRASPKCSFLKAKSRKLPTRIARASIRPRLGLRCRGSSRCALRYECTDQPFDAT